LGKQEPKGEEKYLGHGVSLSKHGAAEKIRKEGIKSIGEKCPGGSELLKGLLHLRLKTVAKGDDMNRGDQKR